MKGIDTMKKYLVIKMYYHYDEYELSQRLMTKEDILKKYGGIYAFGSDKCNSLEDAYLKVAKFQCCGVRTLKEFEKRLNSKNMSLEEWKEKNKGYITYIDTSIDVYELKEDNFIKVNCLDLVK